MTKLMTTGGVVRNEIPVVSTSYTIEILARRFTSTSAKSITKQFFPFPHPQKKSAKKRASVYSLAL